jgi:hypothetical protein
VASERRAERLLFALALLLFGWSFDRDPGPNVVAHIDQATAIALDGTLSIDRFVAGRAEPNTIDWARGPDGRHFPAKAPGTALLSLPVAAPLLHLERALGADPASDAWVLRNGVILNWFLNVLPAAATLVLLLRLARSLGVPEGPALAGVAAVGFGSPYHAYATIFYAHVPAANLVAAGGAAALAAIGGAGAAEGAAGEKEGAREAGSARVGGEKSGELLADVGGGDRISGNARKADEGRWGKSGIDTRRGEAVIDRSVSTLLSPLLAGLLLGLAVLVDYAALFAVLVFGLALLALRPRAVPLFVLGGLPALAAFLTYHAAAFGTPFTTAYAHQNPIFAGPGGSFLTFPPPTRRWLDLTVLPYRGLLFFAPALLLAAPGALAALRSPDRRLRALAVAAPALLALYLGLNACYRVWWGGATTGPRFSVPALPLLAPLVGLGVLRAPRLGAALLAVSVAEQLAIASVSVLAHERAPVPLLDPVLRALAHGMLGRENLGLHLFGLEHPFSLAPLLLGAGALAVLLARSARADRPAPG